MVGSFHHLDRTGVLKSSGVAVLPWRSLIVTDYALGVASLASSRARLLCYSCCRADERIFHFSRGGA